MCLCTCTAVQFVQLIDYTESFVFIVYWEIFEKYAGHRVGWGEWRRHSVT